MTKLNPNPSFFYRNGLSIVFVLLFLFTWIGQAITGWHQHNDELNQVKAASIDFWAYIQSGHFMSATFENFESEFMQMAMYVVLTISLRQKGSAESKSLDKTEEVDRDPKPGPDAPWAVRKGGWVMKIYEHSLSLAFIILFVISWLLHFYGSWQDHNEENLLHKETPDSAMDYLMQANFWFESFQNWQSEFLSIACIVFFTIYLRQKGSPESKPVDAPDMETGT